MVFLSDAQLSLVWDALGKLPTEHDRAMFLRLVDEQLRIRTYDVQSAVERATANVLKG